MRGMYRVRYQSIHCGHAIGLHHDVDVVVVVVVVVVDTTTTNIDDIDVFST